MVIRVLVADDEPLIRAGIRMILTSAPDVEVVGEAPDGAQALRLARELAADVLLLDIRMPVLDGLSALAELPRAAPGTRAIVLTTFGERENVLRAITSGGAGFLLKDTAPGELIQAVRAAATGHAFLSRPPPGTSWTASPAARRPRAANRPDADWPCSPPANAPWSSCSARGCRTPTPAPACT